VGDQNVDLDGDAECLGASDEDMLVVADPNASSTGGGFYMLNYNPAYSNGNPGAHFGYTAQRKYDKQLDEWFTTGNLLWMHKGHWRLKGNITEGGKLPDGACPYDPLDVYPSDYMDYVTGTLTCAAFGGDGTLYEYNESYNPLCPSYLQCGMQWINPEDVSFMFVAYDGGSAKACKGKRCKEVDRPDAFGLIEVDPVDIGDSGGEFVIQLKGGNVVVRGSE